MIINDTYTIRIISSDNPSNFITTVEAEDTDICTVTHDGYNVIVSTNNILGVTRVTVGDFEGRKHIIPILVDDIIYSFDIMYNEEIVTEKSPAVIFYNSGDPTEDLQIIETRYSTFYDRFITEEDINFSHDHYSLELIYQRESNGIILSETNNKLHIEMLSDYSETIVMLSFKSADNSITTNKIKIIVVTDDVLGVFPSKVILDERNTATKRLNITGTRDPITVSGDAVGFSYTIDGNMIDLLPLGANNIGSRMDISSDVNGIIKTSHFDVKVKPFPLYVDNKLKVVEVGVPYTFIVENVINELTLEGAGESLNNFTYEVEYIRNEYKANVTLIPTKKMDTIGTINIIDMVDGRVPRVAICNIKFGIDLDLIITTNNVTAMGIPLKVRFQNAFGPLKFMSVSKITGYNVRTHIEYDVNPYNGVVSETDGFIYVYPTIADNITLSVSDSRSFKSVVLTSLVSPINFKKWIPIIPIETERKYIDNNLSTPIIYDDRLKAGDFVGTTWIDGYKYGTQLVEKISYKISPPAEIKDDAIASLNWMQGLIGTTHNLNISIRDGFILEDIGKNYTVPAAWSSYNSFETADLSELGIYLTSGQTILISDDIDKIAITDNSDKTGVIIYIEEDNEVVVSRIDYKPVVFFELKTVVDIPKIPMNKPTNCYDIKRMNATVEDGEFKIFPSATSDDSIDVLCEFGKDESGADNIWTVIPEKSIRTFSDIVGRAIGGNNEEIDVVSNGGIHPKFYPGAYTSNNSLSYLFFELPFKVESFGYTLHTIETDEKSVGTFKILSDTSDIYHINGLANNHSMLTRQGITLPHDNTLIDSNLGQVVILPQGLDDYEYTVNADGGLITPTTPSDRLIVMNSGTSEDYTLAETFLKELRFKSIYHANNIITNFWVNTAVSGIDLVDIVKLSKNTSWIVSDIISNPSNIIVETNKNTDTSWIISPTPELVDINLQEFVTLESNISALVAVIESPVIVTHEIMEIDVFPHAKIISLVEDNVEPLVANFVTDAIHPNLCTLVEETKLYVIPEFCILDDQMSYIISEELDNVYTPILRGVSGVANIISEASDEIEDLDEIIKVIADVPYIIHSLDLEPMEIIENIVLGSERHPRIIHNNESLITLDYLGVYDINHPVLITPELIQDEIHVLENVLVSSNLVDIISVEEDIVNYSIPLPYIEGNAAMIIYVEDDGYTDLQEFVDIGRDRFPFIVYQEYDKVAHQISYMPTIKTVVGSTVEDSERVHTVVQVINDTIPAPSFNSQEDSERLYTARQLENIVSSFTASKQHVAVENSYMVVQTNTNISDGVAALNRMEYTIAYEYVNISAQYNADNIIISLDELDRHTYTPHQYIASQKPTEVIELDAAFNEEDDVCSYIITQEDIIVDMREETSINIKSHYIANQKTSPILRLPNVFNEEDDNSSYLLTQEDIIVDISEETTINIKGHYIGNQKTSPILRLPGAFNEEDKASAYIVVQADIILETEEESNILLSNHYTINQKSSPVLTL